MHPLFWKKFTDIRVRLKWKNRAINEWNIFFVYKKTTIAMQGNLCTFSERVEIPNWLRKVKRRRRDSLHWVALTVSREADTFDRLFLVSLKVKLRHESRQTGEETGKQTLFSENVPGSSTWRRRVPFLPTHADRIARVTECSRATDFNLNGKPFRQIRNRYLPGESYEACRNLATSSHSSHRRQSSQIRIPQI